MSKLPSLSVLDLRGVDIKDAGVTRISAMKSLQELNLGDGRFTTKGLAQLATLPRLERLFLARVRLKKEEDLGVLGEMRALRSLTLDYLPVTDKTLESLREFAGSRRVEPRQHKHHGSRRGDIKADAHAATARHLSHASIEKSP